jgi:hypothetical protein
MQNLSDSPKIESNFTIAVVIIIACLRVLPQTLFTKEGAFVKNQLLRSKNGKEW